MKKIAVMGAGGKMGCRAIDGLRGKKDFIIAAVEIHQAGIARLAERGITPSPQAEALADAEVVILAIPDVAIGKVTHEIVPKLRSGTIVIGLDPAAAFAGVMPAREDVTFFVCHPCHPPLFNDETDPRARKDWFGGIAKMDLVCALFSGKESHYAIAEGISREMFAPIRQTFRITIEQMAILEPALVETVNSTLITAMKETFDEAIRMGVPEPAANSFMMGHIRTAIAIIFGYSDFPMSDGAKLAIAQAKEVIFKPGWKEKLMNLDSIRKSVAEITRAIQK
jgi:hypothetical protein